MKYNYLDQLFVYAFPAGIFIGIGGAVNCLSGNPLIGALLFSVGLYAICALQLGLVTGKAGYIFENKPSYLLYLAVLWIGNYMGALLCAGLVRLANPAIINATTTIATARLAQSHLQTFASGWLCGVLVHFAVQKNTFPISIFIAIPTFILCGFEHCVADMFYFSAANMFPIGHVLLVTLGNICGAVFLNAWMGLKKLS